ncbi:MAG: glycosyltransferase family 9 protein [Candidatus Hydrogenedentota bacterium]
MTDSHSTRQQTLFVHTGGIGDFLLACPAVAVLAREELVDLLGRRERLQLAVEADVAKAAYSLDAADFDSAFHTPSDRLKAFLAPYNRAIVWMRDEDGTLAANLRACGVERVNTFPGLPPEDWKRSAAEYYAKCLGYTDPPPFRLKLAPLDAPGDVIIHPGSGSARKNWPFERFQAVAEALQEQGLSVAWCAGPAELEQGMDPPGRPLQEDSLVTLARRLAGARLYLGNDSGVTHLAAASGCPTVALFGPTNPAVWAPRGSNVHVIQAAPWPTTRDVLGVVHTRLSKIR